MSSMILQTVGQVAAKAVDDLHRLAAMSGPFFLAVGFRKPHLPFNAPSKYWRPVESIPDLLPDTWHSPAVDIPDDALHRSPELRGQYDALPLFGDPSDAAAAEIVSAYHAAVRYVDAQIGVVLEGLQDSRVANRTLVVLLGDHGFLLGEQRLWTKHSLLEPALRTPLIISHPSIPGGKVVDEVTDLLDVYPTLTELVTGSGPDRLDGQSLEPLLAQPNGFQRSNKRASVSRWMNGESVRNKRFRYTRWFDEDDQTTAEMLFDLPKDPLEQINEVNNPEFAEVVSELKSYLGTARTGPVWSEKLGQQHDRWRLASSLQGGVLLTAMAFPVPVATALLLTIGVLTGVVWRWWSNRRRTTP